MSIEDPAKSLEIDFEEDSMAQVASSCTAGRKFGTFALTLGTLLLPFPGHSQTTDTQGTAQITSVGPISPRAWQTIVITGANFGVNPPFNGCTDNVRITDVTTNRTFPSLGPFGGCNNPILVTSWTDNEIVIEGFPAFQHGQDAFTVGDAIKVEIRNPKQNWATMAWYSLRVTPEGALPPAPRSQSETVVPTQTAATGGIAIPAGTSIEVRMIDSVDSSKNKVGDSFHASLDSPIVIGDNTVVQKGADVFGRLAEAKAAGKISGGAELTLELTSIRIKGNSVPIESTDYEAVGKGRGKQSAERIGGGGALGAIIGGIAGGGKGAAIGAVAGAGAGTAVQLATHGERIHIPSETLLEFKLQDAVQIAAPSATPLPTTPPPPPSPTIVKAIVQNGTELNLPPGSLSIYGFATGGALPSSPFTVGQSAQVEDGTNQLAAALAYGTGNRNSYTTQTAYQVIGGVSIGGSWSTFNAFYGSNSHSGASYAAVTFTNNGPSLAVVIGLASSQQSVTLSGIPGLQVDASSSGPGANEGMVIAHAYLEPGTYTAVEQSAALAAGQDPDHMADLIGVFVFGTN